MGVMMAERKYRMRQRAESQDATRERIVEATTALHRAQGVTATSYVQIAERAGVGAATVYRHFPTLGSLISACGESVWSAIRPPLPDEAEAVFAGLATRAERLDRLAAELDAFYGRSAEWIGIAARDRASVPELDAFLHRVDAGVAAHVRAALGPETGAAEADLAVALADVSVWTALRRIDLPAAEFRHRFARLLASAGAIVGD